jgi:hypothetical protein
VPYLDNGILYSNDNNKSKATTKYFDEPYKHNMDRKEPETIEH